jgi:signal transduction histidine kinase
MIAATHLLWAAPAAQQLRFQEVVAALGVPVTPVDAAETLLYHTRSQAPLAILLDDAVVEGVSQLDLIALLRRRKHLAHTQIVVFGPDAVERHTAALNSGADIYLSYDTAPELVTKYLAKVLERDRADAALRETLSRLRQFEQAHKESERVKDDLTHMLVHDLKSPIASVMGLLEHALDITQAGSDIYGLRELLSLAYGESQHLLNLSANILDVRRMKEGNMPYYPGLIESLSSLAQTALGDVNLSLRERQVSSIVRPEAERLHADGDLLRRVLANLFANAVRHTQQGGHVDFRAWKDDTNYVLSVRDDGEGIPEEDQKRIFNAFEQSRHTLHDRFDTGMGLTFCKLAVEKHGGDIWVESKVGRGSTFFFTVPLTVKAPLEPGDLLLT